MKKPTAHQACPTSRRNNLCTISTHSLVRIPSLRAGILVQTQGIGLQNPRHVLHLLSSGPRTLHNIQHVRILESCNVCSTFTVICEGSWTNPRLLSALSRHAEHISISSERLSNMDVMQRYRAFIMRRSHQSQPHVLPRLSAMKKLHDGSTYGCQGNF